MSDVRRHYPAQFSERLGELPGAGLSWLIDARRAALERFVASGFPTTRDEDWKYTSVAAIERRLFDTRPAPHSEAAGRLAAQLGARGADLLVFVNGRHASGLSRIGPLPCGAKIGSLASALTAGEVLPEELLDGGDEPAPGAFAQLNAAFWSDGAWIDLPHGTVLARPIHLLFIADGNGDAAAARAIFPRNVIRAGEASAATVIEHYAGPDGSAYLTDAVTRIAVGPGATLNHAKVQQEGRAAFHVADIRARQDRDSRYTSSSLALGGLLARNDIATRLEAEGCEAELTGLYVGTGRQHHDHHTCIDHARPRGTSRELYKGVLDGHSRAVFNGRVVVHRDAQRTDARQSNRNLLLSADAEVDTKPQLEIYADDVQCSHGATVGQLDADQLHYLRSRGIDEAAARALLIRAFAAEVLDRVAPAPLRGVLQGALPGGLSEDMRDLPCETPATN